MFIEPLAHFREDVANEGKCLFGITEIENKPQSLDRPRKFAHEEVMIDTQAFEYGRHLVIVKVCLSGSANEREEPQVLGPDMHCEPRPEAVNVMIRCVKIGRADTAGGLGYQRVEFLVVRFQDVVDRLVK